MSGESGAIGASKSHSTAWFDRGADVKPKVDEDDKLKKTDVFTYAANVQGGGFKL